MNGTGAGAVGRVAPEGCVVSVNIGGTHGFGEADELYTKCFKGESNDDV